MANRVFLHVGLPKSGTTFLQSVLWSNKEQLRQSGVLFPGPESWNDQVRAVRDVRNMPTRSREQKQLVKHAWDRLAQEMVAFPGDAVMSMEWLSRVQPQHLDRILTTLAPKEIHVVFTVRDLARVIPASWQESVLNQRDATWRDFLSQISDEAVPREERPLWRLHDLLPLIGRWIDRVPGERIHVVTVPRPGTAPETLWNRFAGVVGLQGVPVEMDLVRRNDGLGLTSSELMRRLNMRARERDLDEESRRTYFTRQLAKEGLVRREDPTGRPTIPPEWHAWVEAESEARIAGLRDAGVDIVGDLEELRPDLSAHQASTPEPTAEELLDAALDAMVMLAEQRAARTAEADAERARLEAEVARLTRRLERVKQRHAQDVARWRDRPVRAALRAYSTRPSLGARALRRLRRRS